MGFLNYSLFPEYPEFFATYQLANTSCADYSYLYSDKLRISVVDLTQIDRATEEDKKYGIDKWARLLTATTREEIDMLTEKHEVFTGTATIIYDFNEDRLMRQQCQAREDFLYWERIKENRNKRMEAKIAEQEAEIATKDAEIARQQAELEHQQAELERQQAELEKLRSQLKSL